MLEVQEGQTAEQLAQIPLKITPIRTDTILPKERRGGVFRMSAAEIPDRESIEIDFFRRIDQEIDLDIEINNRRADRAEPSIDKEGYADPENLLSVERYSRSGSVTRSYFATDTRSCYKTGVSGAASADFRKVGDEYHPTEIFRVGENYPQTQRLSLEAWSESWPLLDPHSLVLTMGKQDGHMIIERDSKGNFGGFFWKGCIRVVKKNKIDYQESSVTNRLVLGIMNSRGCDLACERGIPLKPLIAGEIATVQGKNYTFEVSYEEDPEEAGNGDFVVKTTVEVNGQPITETLKIKRQIDPEKMKETLFPTPFFEDPYTTEPGFDRHWRDANLEYLMGVTGTVGGI